MKGKKALNLDIKSILSPIAGDNPSGDNLLYTSVYDSIKEAKRSDDSLEKGEWFTATKTSDWRLTIKICTEALTTKSKDLQIAVWLTEALTYHHGFEGLAFGLQLLSRLVLEFWETLYPEIEGGDLDYRAGSFTYLNEKLPGAIYQVPICDPDHSKGFGFYDWEESKQVGFENGLDKEQKAQRQALINSGKISAEEFKAAVNLSSIGFYKELQNHLFQCRNHLKKLDENVTQKFTPDPPGFTRIAGAIEECLHIVQKIYTEKKKSEVITVDVVEIDDIMSDRVSDDNIEPDDFEQFETCGQLLPKLNAISDISEAEIEIWRNVANKAGNGHLKSALDQLMAAAALSPSVRQKNRYLLLVAKLCIRAGRYDLANPIVEKIYELIEKFKLEMWEHPAWIADVVETLYQCLKQNHDGTSERAIKLFQKLCTLNTTRAAAYRV